MTIKYCQGKCYERENLNAGYSTGMFRLNAAKFVALPIQFLNMGFGRFNFGKFSVSFSGDTKVNIKWKNNSGDTISVMAVVKFQNFQIQQYWFGKAISGHGDQ